MELSVVVPTLNGRERLAGTLDALAAHIPAAEVIVVNGPSADGTTGMVRDRDDVDVLVEIADRTVTAARNAGFEQASGDVVALVSHGLAVTDDWRDAVADGLSEAPVVSGPTQERLRAGKTTESVESREIRGHEVTYFNSGNVAFERSVLERLDGFDEYLHVGGSRDLAHRLAIHEYSVAWNADMAVETNVGADGGSPEIEWDWKYRSLAYRLVKNYGLRPSITYRIARHGVRDAASGFSAVVRTESDPSQWLATGRDALKGSLVGVKDGLLARANDRTTRRNPRGLAARTDRAVAVYDWR
jgi:glycosyltransferase involved in cell wall biosynthesis